MVDVEGNQSRVEVPSFVSRAPRQGATGDINGGTSAFTTEETLVGATNTDQGQNTHRSNL
jgi:hypothetical protein